MKSRKTQEKNGNNKGESHREKERLRKKTKEERMMGGKEGRNKVKEGEGERKCASSVLPKTESS